MPSSPSRLSSCSPLRLAQLQKVTQLHPCLVELRFAIADGTAQHLGNFIVFVTLDIMQHKDDAVSRRQTLDGPPQVDPIDGSGQDIVTGTDVPPGTIFVLRLQGLLQRNFREPFLAQVHEHYVHRQAMQPGGERRFTAKRGDLAIKLQEGLLRQVFRFRRVADHAQAKRIHPALVQTIQGCEALGIAQLGAVNRFLLGDAVSQNLLSGRQIGVLDLLPDSMQRQ